LVNGVSGHADDFDDTQLSTSSDRIYGLLTHPTVPPLAAALAIGEKTGCTGKEFLEAFIAGFEVECKLAEAINPKHYMRGFHTTATLGAFGALSASSKLLRLNEEELRYAIGITASLSSGIRANFGTMTKPLHAGNAARNGVVSSLLARDGFSAAESILESQFGFANVFAGKSEPDFGKVVFDTKQPLEILTSGIGIKRYASCMGTHTALDAIFNLISAYQISPEMVARIQCRVHRLIPDVLIHHSPKTGLEGKFSMEFCMAIALIDKKAGLEQFTDEKARQPSVRELMSKVDMIIDPTIKAVSGASPAVVTISTKDGRQFSERVDVPKGYPPNFPSFEDVAEKFCECTERLLAPQQIRKCLTFFRTLEKAPKPISLSLLSPNPY